MLPYATAAVRVQASSRLESGVAEANGYTDEQPLMNKPRHPHNIAYSPHVPNTAWRTLDDISCTLLVHDFPASRPARFLWLVLVMTQCSKTTRLKPQEHDKQNTLTSHAPAMASHTTDGVNMMTLGERVLRRQYDP